VNATMTDDSNQPPDELDQEEEGARICNYCIKEFHASLNPKPKPKPKA
jgi:hypothetical protein